MYIEIISLKLLIYSQFLLYSKQFNIFLNCQKTLSHQYQTHKNIDVCGIYTY